MHIIVYSTYSVDAQIQTCLLFLMLHCICYCAECIWWDCMWWCEGVILTSAQQTQQSKEDNRDFRQWHAPENRKMHYIYWMLCAAWVIQLWSAQCFDRLKQITSKKRSPTLKSQFRVVYSSTNECYSCILLYQNYKLHICVFLASSLLAC